jgi:RNA polymerase sigma factor (sigma-70 family)
MGSSRSSSAPPGTPRPQETDPLEADLLLLYDTCAPGLLRFASICTHEPGEAREAVQQAFLDLLSAWRAGEQIPQPRGWLYRAVRQFVVLARDRAERQKKVEEELNRNAPHAAQPDYDAPKRREEVRRRLVRIASPREYEILQLRVEGFSYEEIAAILEIHQGTVASTLSRVVRKVRSAFKTDFPGC